MTATKVVEFPQHKQSLGERLLSRLFPVRYSGEHAEVIARVLPFVPKRTT